MPNNEGASVSMVDIEEPDQLIDLEDSKTPIVTPLLPHTINIK